MVEVEESIDENNVASFIGGIVRGYGDFLPDRAGK
jgi:hypothetical protein